MKTMTAVTEPKPYHHGDLRRGLLDSANAILEREGPSALSLRAVAREAGVSPAAPYHHFKDKDELLFAIAKEGFSQLKTAIAAAAAKELIPRDKMSRLGLAYVEFAQSHPALYRVMYDCAREGDSMPDGAEHEEGAFQIVKDALGEAGGNHVSETDIHLAAIAAWCAAHGLAEMSSFTQFKSLKDELGGEQAFLRGVLEHLGIYGRLTEDK
jgi:AcrR family transcriptional regulator